MSNSRSFRRRLTTSGRPRAGRGMIRPQRWKDKRAPQLGTVRKWMRGAEAEGLVERTGEVERTGKPGRPAQLWTLSEAGRARAKNRAATP